MKLALKSLLALLNLEKLDDDLFQGQSMDLGLRQLYGGQVVGQAIYAATQTVLTERIIHSFHSYFLRPGDSKKNIIYQVETLRDGKSFSTRRIKAIQHGQPIFYMTASFQSSEPGLEHQKAMPEVHGPDGLYSEAELAQHMAETIPVVMRDKFLAEQPFEVRPVIFHNPLKGHVDKPHRSVWLRANGSVPIQYHLHQYLLGYASDFNFLAVALQPHGKGLLEPEMQVATLDHSMWFHRLFDINDWLLYSVESTSASGARGFVRGEFYTKEGKLVASSVQEGLIRVRQT